MRSPWAARVPIAMAALAASASCNAVLGIQAYGPGPDGGPDSDGDLEGGGASNEAGPCTPGDKRCSGNDVETCDDSKSWGRGSPCSAGETCSGGSCYATPPSCAPAGVGRTTCGNGGSGSESCCTTRMEIPTMTFDRSFDGRSPGFTSKAYSATVSAFRLDAFEISVGRFRPFVDAVVAGYRPPMGSGKHQHLSGGAGLAATGGGFESGWDAAWNAELGATASDWNLNLSGGTWTAAVSDHEELPLTAIDWIEAYAFCIWDRGFLPSEAEWDDAAAGGSEQRARPWAVAYPPGSTAITCGEANFSGCKARAPNAVGSESPAGDGRWGHSDLVGNVWEWNLDWFAPYTTSCLDCANVTPGTSRVLRGGSFRADTALVLASNRYLDSPTGRAYDIGARCARSP